MKYTVVLVCGGRDYDDEAEVVYQLLELRKKHGNLCIVHGASSGADELAGETASAQGWPCFEVPAHWDKLRKRAGHIRNGWMLQFMKPDLVLAFPGGRGTANMIKQAKDARVPVILVKA